MTAVGASQSVFEYLDRKPVQKPSGILQPHEFRGDIEFKNVSLVYPARPDEQAIQVNWSFEMNSFLTIVDTIFQNISFKIPAGQTCGFVGPSGSGRSNLYIFVEIISFFKANQLVLIYSNVSTIQLKAKY